ncbi:MAG: hypothetical protein LJU34_06995 [Oscillospiraceae bacterium]|nr:hypothetical protein [Oscillospiraceae bacterium]
MKKCVVCVLGAATIALLLTGCGGSGSKDSASESVEVEDVETVEYGEFTWPKSEIAALIPVPESNIGEVYWEASYGFVIYVAETSQDDYDAYVDACWENGFTIDYHKGSDYFWADNEDGYKVTVRYDVDSSVMMIRMDEPDEIEETEEVRDDENLQEDLVESNDAEEEYIEETEAEQSAVETETSSDGIDPDFKEALDSYEAFMNEYVEFMKEYMEADSSDLVGLLADYASYMAQYADMMDKIDAIYQDELSNEELAYYLEVTGRVLLKLSEIS